MDTVFKLFPLLPLSPNPSCLPLLLLKFTTAASSMLHTDSSVCRRPPPSHMDF